MAASAVLTVSRERTCTRSCFFPSEKVQRSRASRADQVDRAVEQQHARVDARVATQEVAHDGEHVQAPEYNGRGDRKLALGLTARAGELRLGGVELIEDAAAGVEILAARLGEVQAARRAREEAGAELVFKRGKLAAHGGQRHAELATGGGEAARIGDRRKEPHGAEPIHRNLP
jgi:hypothetical protein